MTTEFHSFFTGGLLSKWGFNDGAELLELLCDFIAQLRAEGADIVVVDDHHDFLVAAVEEFVIPVLEHRIEYYEIGTSHNPIRATKVDDQPVVDTAIEQEIRLSPETIEVPILDLWNLYRRMSGLTEHQEIPATLRSTLDREPEKW